MGQELRHALDTMAALVAKASHNDLVGAGAEATFKLGFPEATDQCRAGQP